jgi:hypothetical protein
MGSEQLAARRHATPSIIDVLPDLLAAALRLAVLSLLAWAGCASAQAPSVDALTAEVRKAFVAMADNDAQLDALIDKTFARCCIRRTRR